MARKILTTRITLTSLVISVHVKKCTPQREFNVLKAETLMWNYVWKQDTELWKTLYILYHSFTSVHIKLSVFHRSSLSLLFPLVRKALWRDLQHITLHISRMTFTFKLFICFFWSYIYLVSVQSESISKLKWKVLCVQGNAFSPTEKNVKGLNFTGNWEFQSKSEKVCADITKGMTAEIWVSIKISKKNVKKRLKTY